MTTGTFPPDVIAAAKASMAKWHVPASVSLAQWALESAWGTALPPGSNNPFGIKAAKGKPSVSVPTHEVIHGRYVRTVAAFAKYASLADAFDAHARLLATAQAYTRAQALRSDPRAFAHALTGVYATDPAYGNKLVALIDHYQLVTCDRA